MHLVNPYSVQPNPRSRSGVFGFSNKSTHQEGWTPPLENSTYHSSHFFKDPITTLPNTYIEITASHPPGHIAPIPSSRRSADDTVLFGIGLGKQNAYLDPLFGDFEYSGIWGVKAARTELFDPWIHRGSAPRYIKPSGGRSPEIMGIGVNVDGQLFIYKDSKVHFLGTKYPFQEFPSLFPIIFTYQLEIVYSVNLQARNPALGGPYKQHLPLQLNPLPLQADTSVGFDEATTYADQPLGFLNLPKEVLKLLKSIFGESFDVFRVLLQTCKLYHKCFHPHVRWIPIQKIRKSLVGYFVDKTWETPKNIRAELPSFCWTIYYEMKDDGSFNALQQYFSPESWNYISNQISGVHPHPLFRPDKIFVWFFSNN